MWVVRGVSIVSVFIIAIVGSEKEDVVSSVKDRHGAFEIVGSERLPCVLCQQHTPTLLVLQVNAMLTILFAFFLAIVPFRAATADECDRLYTAARDARADVIHGKGEVRSAPAEKREWRRTVNELLSAVEQVRACYSPLPLPDQTPSSTPDDAALPTPASVARQRMMQTYRWAVLAHRELQQYDAAFQQYDAFFERFGAAADSSRIAFMYNSRGYLQYRLGNLIEAVSDYTRTIERTPAADTLGRAGLLIDLGNILQQMDDLRTAQQYYAQAELLVQAGPSPSGRRRELLARAQFNQGDILLNWPSDDASTRTARYQRAIELLQQAIALFPEGDWERLPRAHLVLGDAYRLTGHLDAAFGHIEQGETLAASYTSTRNSQSEILALAALVRGDAEIAAGRLDAAAAAFKDALRFSEIGNQQDRRLSALEELGALYKRQGDLTQAEAYYRRAITVANERRASLRATEWAAFTSDEWSAPYRGLVDVLAAQGRHKEAFLALDRSRARHLQDTRLQTRVTNALPAHKRVRFDSLTAALANVRNALATEDLSAERRAELEQEEVRLMASRGTLLDLESTGTLSSIAALQQTLQSQQRALVAYYIDDPRSGTIDVPPSFAFVVTPRSFRHVPLRANADTLRHQIAAVSPMLREGDARFRLSAVNFDLAALHQLYASVFAPVSDALPDGLPLTIIPDGPLFRLPFSMLVTEPVQGRAYDRAPYLIRERPLSMELSATLIGDTTRAADRFALDIAALGRTRFEAVPSLPPVLRARLDSAGSLPALPGVQQEMEVLRDQFARRQILTDAEATERRVRTLQSQTKILHLASHALIHPSDPLANLFVLSPARSTGAQNDGLLFVHELGAQYTPVPLVVLSGCRTARGLMRTGEGPKGLQYAFRSTGARSTLSTLWDVEDQATVALTRSFYDHLIDGHPKDVALQQAQLDLIERFPNRASPFFWAGALLYGTPQPLSLQPAPLVPLFPVAAGGAILLLIALGFGYSRYRRH